MLSDGQPTDDYKNELGKLMSLPWGKKSVRIAIAIGQDAEMGVLSEITGNKELVLQANSAEALVRMIKWASTVASVVSAPSSRQGEASDTSSNVALDVNNIPKMDDTGSGDVW